MPGLATKTVVFAKTESRGTFMGSRRLSSRCGFGLRFSDRMPKAKMDSPASESLLVKPQVFFIFLCKASGNGME